MQSSKKRSCEISSISGEIVKQLTKEELLILATTPFSLSHYSFRNDEEYSFPYTFSVAEIDQIVKKYSYSTLFKYCHEPVVLIESPEIDNGELTSIFDDETNRSIIMSKADVLKAFLSKAKKVKVSISTSSVENLSKILTAEEIRSYLEISSRDKCSLINLKGCDGEFVVTENEIITEIVTDKYSLESEEFLSNIILRDRPMAKLIVEAYLKGNKGLSDFTKTKVNLRRSETSKFEALKKELSLDPKVLVDEIFAKGGDLYEFKKSFLDWQKTLRTYHEGRVVKVAEIDGISSLSDFEELPVVKFEVGVLRYGHRYYYREESEVVVPSNVRIKAVSGSSISESDINILKQVLDKSGVAIFTVDENAGFGLKYLLFKNKISFTGEDAFVHSMVRDFTQEILADKNGFVLEDFQVMDDNGLVLSKEVVLKIIENYKQSEDVIAWLAARSGDFHGAIITSEDLEEVESFSTKELFLKLGVRIMSKYEEKLFLLEKSIFDQGSEFQPVEIEDLDLKGKKRIISYISSEIDPNYKNLGLELSNLEDLNILYSFSKMKSVSSLEDGDLARIFNIPTNVTQNKKIMKGIKDLVSIKGSSLPLKAQALREIIQSLNPKLEVVVSDYLDFSNVAEVMESDSFSKISFNSISSLQKYSQEIKMQGIILKNKDKGEILHFLRSASEQSSDYLRDTLQMIEAVIRGVEAIFERAKTLNEDPEETERVNELNQSASSILSRLEEVSAMDDVVHMHDRLVPLLSFIKADPVQPLGQDRFKKLEQDKNLIEVMGNYSVYFPKTRGDLQFLGDENGWCVNRNSYYGDNVISKGNILVAICAKGKPAARENAVALAHFEKQGPRNYYLEQLRWSTKIKGHQADAKGDFNHSGLLREIISYLDKYNQEKVKNGLVK